MRPYVEPDCVITHEGRTFEAGGAVVTHDRIIAYPAAGGILQDWHGNPLGTWRATSSWVAPGAWGCPRMYQIEARVNGVVYTGRGLEMAAETRDSNEYGWISITRAEYDKKVVHDQAGPGTPCHPDRPGVWVTGMDETGAKRACGRA